MGAVGRAVQKVAFIAAQPITLPFAAIAGINNPGLTSKLSGGLLSEGQSKRLSNVTVGGFSGAATGFVTSGFNPLGGVAGFGTGAIQGGLKPTNASAAIVAEQSAVGGAIAGAATGAGQYLADKYQAAKDAAANIKATGSYLYGNGAPTSADTPGPIDWAAPYAGGAPSPTPAAAAVKSSGGLFGGVGDTLKTLGPLAALQLLGHNVAPSFIPAPGGSTIVAVPTPQTDFARDYATSQGLPPTVVPQGDPVPSAGLATMFAPGSALALIIPGGLVAAGIYYLWKHYRKK